ncbi:hypothetical protein FQZ97_725550 [compost metagenome]
MLFLGDVAQHPDETQALRLVAEIAATDVEQAGHAVLLDFHQVRAKVAVECGAVQQQRIEARQQLQQVPVRCVAVGQTEQLFGLRVEVVQLAVAVGDQHPLLDRAQCAGGLA